MIKTKDASWYRHKKKRNQAETGIETSLNWSHTGW